MNLKKKLIALRMDTKLANQLVRFAKANEGGNKSLVARKAIEKYIKEITSKDFVGEPQQEEKLT